MEFNKKNKFKFAPEKISYLLLVFIPLIGMFLKNIFYLSFVFGDNRFRPDFANAFSHSGIFLLTQAAIIIGLFAFAFLFKDKGKYIYAIIINILFTVLLIIDLYYIRFFNDLPSVRMVTIIDLNSESTPSGEGSLMLPIQGIDIFFLIDIIGWFALLISVYLSDKKHFIADSGKINKLYKTPYPFKMKHKTGIIIFSVMELISIICISVVPILYSIDNEKYSNIYDDSYNASYMPAQSVAFTPAGYHIGDIFSSLFASKSLSENDAELINSYFKWNSADYYINEYFGALKDKNVIILQMESFENFVIGQKIDGQEITPNINKMINSGYYFNNIYDQVCCGNSSDCDLQIMTSLLPATKVSAFNFYDENTYNSLPQILSSDGYKTIYFNCLKNSFWNYMPMIQNGIKFSDSDFDFDLSDKIGSYVSDESFLDQIVNKLVEKNYNSGDYNFYAHGILSSSHGPFDINEKYRELKFNDELENSVVGGYLHCVNYVDKQIGLFVDKLEQSGLMDNTVLMLMGDHGGLHKYFPYAINELSDESYETFMGKNYDYRLPFIIYDPSMSNSVVCSTSGGHIDLMPTLLYLLGEDFKAYKNSAMGRCLLATKRNCTISAHGIIYGEPSTEDLYFLKKAYKISDRILTTDYFKR